MYLPRQQTLTPAGQLASIKKEALTHNHNLACFAKSINKGGSTVVSDSSTESVLPYPDQDILRLNQRPFCGCPDAQYHDLLQPDLPLFRLPAVVDPEPLIRVLPHDLFHDFCETLGILQEILLVVPRSGNFDQGFQN